MDMIYQVIALAIMLSAAVTGFITFRMSGMKLAIHFGALMLALVVTLAALATGIQTLVYGAAIIQVMAALTAYTQLWATLKYNFQTSPSYAPHIALVTMLPVFAIATLV
ncbi:hypothetical protein CUJ83_11370 [Methanocella sp. CWC-04]|uniref:Uncharacterized protein n=1 Tax=Methanooceanicella nereidis TaxID=2052831 RepID=A0AAP2RE42_9EURY|nr:DUF5400 family protein [Methanocella sp. CWC-04]MCD1295598.1 hypothetical protein [Methanocella sp. CWC-04]